MAVCRVTLTATLYGSLIQNVWHFNVADYVTAKLAALLAAMDTLWMAPYKDMWVSETFFIQLRGEQLTALGVGDVSILPLTKIGGAGNDRRSPLHLAQVIQLTTGIGGKRNRGRFYVGGITVNSMLDGVFTQAHLNTSAGYINTLKSRWVSPNSTADSQLVIHGPNDAHTDFRVVTNMASRATPGSQRRRLIGVGA
jgi:hypothetical protein